LCDGGCRLTVIMHKITIKCSAETAPTKVELLERLRPFNIRISGIQLRGKVFHVSYDDGQDLDNLFSDDCIAKLEELQCSPVLPPALRSSRTVILFRVDDLIYDNSTETIREEIQRANRNLRVDDIYKFENSRTVKITFTSQRMAIECSENGLNAFYLHVAPANITRDRHVDVSVCFRCFKMDDHISDNCPMDKNFLVCSLCSVVGHSYRNCTSTVRKCLNCEGNHSALAYKCPMRKEIVKAKRLQNTESYARRAAIGPVKTSNVAAALQPDASVIISRSTVCVMIAALKEKESRGTFEEVLNRLLTANNLPSISMGDVTPPAVNMEPDNVVPKPPVAQVIPKDLTRAGVSSRQSSSTSTTAQPLAPTSVRSKRNRE